MSSDGDELKRGLTCVGPGLYSDEVNFYADIAELLEAGGFSNTQENRTLMRAAAFEIAAEVPDGTNIVKFIE